MTVVQSPPSTDFSLLPRSVVDEKMPHFRMVPKDLLGNLRWRKRILIEASNDEAIAADLWRLCAEDALFWINSFLWAYDSRLPPGRRIGPFITYEFQDGAIVELLLAKGLLPPYEPHDILIEKSRAMGASWMCVQTDLWAWQFQHMAAFLWVSRNENLVDKTDDPDTLFWKADWALKNQPGWLRPKHARSNLHLLNLETGSTIDGQSTTGDVARGGRRTSVLLDEFAAVMQGKAVLSATADTTDCRVFNSTPKGTGNAFYTMRETSIKKLRLHWPMHPLKGKDRYKDPVSGEWRSPWYDRECKRRGSKKEIGQELDLDYAASGSPFYDLEVLKTIQTRDVRQPYHRGELTFTVKEDLSPETDEGTRRVTVSAFEKTSAGRLLLWHHLAPDGRPPADRDYVLGTDVSAGSDASNSVCVVVDKLTGEKVAELATINMLPHDFAEYVIALAMWYGGARGEAYLVWEDNGPGQIFGKQVIDLGWRYLHYRTDSGRLRNRPSDRPGWFNVKGSKIKLLGSHRSALARGTFIERSLEAVQEAREYINLPGGRVGFARAERSIDPTGARENHGDRVMAAALATLGLEEVEGSKAEQEQVSEFTFGARRRRARVQRLRDLGIEE